MPLAFSPPSRRHLPASGAPEEPAPSSRAFDSLVRLPAAGSRTAEPSRLAPGGDACAGPPCQAVTCTIITFNEADRIDRCIRSVQGLVREVVVVDCGSTDGTPAMATALGARVIHNDWTGFGPQKRFAEDAARHDWILNLDADEWLSDAARRELGRLLARPLPEAIHGYRFDIVPIYPDAERPRLLPDTHHYVRLYDRRRCRFPTSLVHDEVKPAAAHTGQIRSPVYHRSIRSIRHLLDKNIAYFRLQSREIHLPPAVAAARLLLEPPFFFLKYYLLRGHCTGGLFGLRVALAATYLRAYRLVVLGFGSRR
ncbi:glycosyltransferase family 2 protein [Labrys wisconsinensis]|uniref:Glycosyltransferase involved in cell wall biosynthesis n=1 Tax=Labrys wisconsinensis TaxID=425677 RepID=A0ABU0JG97_9HYPH|nr:glycosyltransferase family 2 protein [Labrys wisconsinensis]MDQ0473320.1 glycosyltransferase involved in cell wall biosynthesis [Labrys wisconsinensis]